MDYDTWKLMTPEEDNGTAYDEYVPVDVEVEIFDLGQNLIDDLRDGNPMIHFEDGATRLKAKIQVDALLTVDDFEKECYVEEEDVKNAVAAFLGKDCEYEILNWRRV
jgi:hypothetical protein